MRRKRVHIVTVPCRRKCGRTVSTLSKPIHSTQADFKRYSGICRHCLSDEELADMRGPMLMRTARNIQRRLI